MARMGSGRSPLMSPKGGRGEVIVVFRLRDTTVARVVWEHAESLPPPPPLSPGRRRLLPSSPLVNLLTATGTCHFCSPSKTSPRPPSHRLRRPHPPLIKLDIIVPNHPPQTMKPSRVRQTRPQLQRQVVKLHLLRQPPHGAPYRRPVLYVQRTRSQDSCTRASGRTSPKRRRW